jgi:hypothetical protein
MRTLLLLVILTGISWWGSRVLRGTTTAPLPRWPRGQPSNRRATRVIYRHMDQQLGAREVLIDKRAKDHAKVAFWISPKLAMLIPRTWPGVPLPMTHTMRHWIREIGDFREVAPNHVVPHRVRLHYTSEAWANGPTFIEDLTRGRRRRGGGLAQALGLEWFPDMFTVQWNRRVAEITFLLRERIPMPVTGDGDGGLPPTVVMPDYEPPGVITGDGQPANPERRDEVIS